MRHLATIQKIEEVKPIENADSIEKVRVKDWWVVSQKGNFEPDDLCVYFEIDSLLPADNPIFEFLSKGNKPKNAIIDGQEIESYGYRLKTIKLRGQVSQGLALPIAEVFDVSDPEEMKETGLVPCLDVTETLRVVKYEPPIPANLSGQVKGHFPGFLPKTDEERVQNLGDVITKHRNEKFYVTEKLDGSSATFYKHNGEFGVCSRNLELLDTPENTLWEMARKYDLSKRLLDGYAVQAEIVGEGIQKNPLKLKGQDIYVFNVYDIRKAKYLDFELFVTFCKDFGLKTVPIVDADYSLYGEVDALLRYTEGKSSLNENVEREGLVFRPLEEQREEMNGSVGRLSFKVISNNYLLKHE